MKLLKTLIFINICLTTYLNISTEKLHNITDFIWDIVINDKSLTSKSERSIWVNLYFQKSQFDKRIESYFNDIDVNIYDQYTPFLSDLSKQTMQLVSYLNICGHFNKRIEFLSLVEQNMLKNAVRQVFSYIREDGGEGEIGSGDNSGEVGGGDGEVGGEEVGGGSSTTPAITVSIKNNILNKPTTPSSSNIPTYASSSNITTYAQSNTIRPTKPSIKQLIYNGLPKIEMDFNKFRCSGFKPVNFEKLDLQFEDLDKSRKNLSLIYGDGNNVKGIKEFGINVGKDIQGVDKAVDKLFVNQGVDKAVDKLFLNQGNNRFRGVREYDINISGDGSSNNGKISDSEVSPIKINLLSTGISSDKLTFNELSPINVTSNPFSPTNVTSNEFSTTNVTSNPFSPTKLIKSTPTKLNTTNIENLNITSNENLNTTNTERSNTHPSSNTTSTWIKPDETSPYWIKSTPIQLKKEDEKETFADYLKKLYPHHDLKDINEYRRSDKNVSYNKLNENISGVEEMNIIKHIPLLKRITDMKRDSNLGKNENKSDVVKLVNSSNLDKDLIDKSKLNITKESKLNITNDEDKLNKMNNEITETLKNLRATSSISRIKLDLKSKENVKDLINKENLKNVQDLISANNIKDLISERNLKDVEELLTDNSSIKTKQTLKKDKPFLEVGAEAKVSVPESNIEIKPFVNLSTEIKVPLLKLINEEKNAALVGSNEEKKPLFKVGNILTKPYLEGGDILKKPLFEVGNILKKPLITVNNNVVIPSIENSFLEVATNDEDSILNVDTNNEGTLLNINTNLIDNLIKTDILKTTLTDNLNTTNLLQKLNDNNVLKLNSSLLNNINSSLLNILNSSTDQLISLEKPIKKVKFDLNNNKENISLPVNDSLPASGILVNKDFNNNNGTTDIKFYNGSISSDSDDINDIDIINDSKYPSGSSRVSRVSSGSKDDSRVSNKDASGNGSRSVNEIDSRVSSKGDSRVSSKDDSRISSDNRNFSDNGSRSVNEIDSRVSSKGDSRVSSKDDSRISSDNRNFSDNGSRSVNEIDSKVSSKGDSRVSSKDDSRISSDNRNFSDNGSRSVNEIDSKVSSKGDSRVSSKDDSRSVNEIESKGDSRLIIDEDTINATFTPQYELPSVKKLRNIFEQVQGTQSNGSINEESFSIINKSDIEKMKQESFDKLEKHIKSTIDRINNHFITEGYLNDSKDYINDEDYINDNGYINNSGYGNGSDNPYKEYLNDTSYGEIELRNNTENDNDNKYIEDTNDSGRYINSNERYINDTNDSDRYIKSNFNNDTNDTKYIEGVNDTSINSSTTLLQDNERLKPKFEYLRNNNEKREIGSKEFMETERREINKNEEGRENERKSDKNEEGSDTADGNNKKGPDTVDGEGSGTVDAEGVEAPNESNLPDNVKYDVINTTNGVDSLVFYNNGEEESTWSSINTSVLPTAMFSSISNSSGPSVEASNFETSTSKPSSTDGPPEKVSNDTLNSLMSEEGASNKTFEPSDTTYSPIITSTLPTFNSTPIIVNSTSPSQKQFNETFIPEQNSTEPNLLNSTLVNSTLTNELEVNDCVGLKHQSNILYIILTVFIILGFSAISTKIYKVFKERRKRPRVFCENADNEMERVDRIERNGEIERVNDPNNSRASAPSEESLSENGIVNESYKKIDNVDNDVAVIEVNSDVVSK